MTLVEIAELFSAGAGVAAMLRVALRRPRFRTSSDSAPPRPAPPRPGPAPAPVPEAAPGVPSVADLLRDLPEGTCLRYEGPDGCVVTAWRTRPQPSPQGEAEKYRLW
ncbi:hypothetical protein [Streptomyces sp. URMC 123]|uniref:hypothetical protein n=1 Tax=Streptomyces sp. URMC 123 TaxID=3423403 RepID=UPI003F19411F